VEGPCLREFHAMPPDYAGKYITLDPSDGGVPGGRYWVGGGSCLMCHVMDRVRGGQRRTSLLVQSLAHAYHAYEGGHPSFDEVCRRANWLRWLAALRSLADAAEGLHQFTADLKTRGQLKDSDILREVARLPKLDLSQSDIRG
jgi:hypothetical protein